MKKVFAVLAAITLATLVSCQKQQTEAEKNAEIEREVQQRLAAEHQTEQEKQLSQRQADLEAREKALAEKENTAATPAPGRERAESEAYQSRVRQPRENAPTRGYSTFYTKLEPHGAWFETSDYGYVWQPRQAESSRAWRPYTNGRWVYTDVGWTWISEEPFGWATYHYGRWTRLHGIGWVWVPGNEWAPAWVSWRKSNDYVGWAPLPPEARFDQRTGIHNWSDNYYDIGPDQYCFVASREFGASKVETTLLPSERNVTIVNQTTNITNITYNNTTIVNEGPSYEEIRTQSREPVQRFRLERNVNIDVSTEPSRPVVQGETVVIAAPVIAAPIATERPRTVKQTVAQVAVDLGWEAIADHEAAKKAREKMKSEATPPPNAPSKKFVRATAAAAPPTQAGQTSAASTSASGTATPMASATIAPAATETATPTPKMTPRRVAAPEQSTAPLTSPATSASPAAAQRRGRLLVPSTPTPSAPTKPATSKLPTPVATKPSAPETISSPSPIATAPAEAPARGKAKSEGQHLNARGVGATASPAATSTSSSSVTPAASSPENLTKKERKEQKREEKKELKRERREGFESASPSATP